MKRILKESGQSVLLGNEAIVRGALEAGVQFASTYPGTPASEIGDRISAIQSSKDRLDNLYFEYSTNEEAAIEAGIGASYSGLKTLVAMKHFGVNVASDALMPFIYTGSKGPTVIAVADDPSCHSSGQSEQNTRAFADLAHIPILEPADVQEAKDYTKKAFKISEKYNVPVMVRITTRIAHQSQPVDLEDYQIPEPEAQFERDFKQYVTLPPRVLEMKGELLEKIKKLRIDAEKSPLNKLENKDKNDELGILTSSVSYLHVMEAQKKLDTEIPTLKLAHFHPAPEEKIKQFLKDHEKILVVEELEPYLENQIKALAKNTNSEVEILGKEELTQAKEFFSENLSAEIEELRPEYLIKTLADLKGKDYNPTRIQAGKDLKHIPRFCDKCPYWDLFASVKKSVRKFKEDKERDIIYGGDIGCYMMSGLSHTQMQDYLLNMGSSVGIAHGLEKAFEHSQNEKQKLIAFIGDSTFFHSGMTNLVNAVYNNSDPLIIIFDNRITAMTGQQPNPGMEETGMGEEGPNLDLKKVVKGLGVKHVKEIDPVGDPGGITKIVKEYLQKDEPSVLISRNICWMREKDLQEDS